jgi:hypothetical protein
LHYFRRGKNQRQCYDYHANVSGSSWKDRVVVVVVLVLVAAYADLL